MTHEWRSSAAQTFVQGRIAKIDNFWGSQGLTFMILDKIDEWDLWSAAFGGKEKKARELWKDYRSGPGITDKARRFFGGKDRMIGKELMDFIDLYITQKMQNLFNECDLTINFNANGWFAKGVPSWGEYASMWDRLKDADLKDYQAAKGNFPHTRAKADRWALYGQFSEGKVDTRSAKMNLPYVWDKGRGKAKNNGADPAYNYHYSETKSEPDSTQVYAALNYKKRPHGSNTYYGKSYAILKSSFKSNAIYFPLDTFTPLLDMKGQIEEKSKRTKLYQVSANAFGGGILCSIAHICRQNGNAMVQKSCKELFKDLLEAARGVGIGQDLTGTANDAHLMVEAHIFQRVSLNPKCIKRMMISKDELGSPNSRSNLDSFQTTTGIPATVIN